MSATLLIIGREAGREVLETHARRLAAQGTVEEARVLLYDQEPERELRAELAAVDADTVYAVPGSFAHTHDTTDAIPAALSAVEGVVRYCHPVGRSPAVTDVLAERCAAAAGSDSGEGTNGGTSLVLVGLGNSSLPFQKQAAEYHAARLRERDDIAEVHACYLLQNPAAECARYNVSGDAVAVPLFLADCPSTRESIPDRLELGRGGIAYADTLGTHPRVTDAIAGEIERERAVGAEETDDAIASAMPMAADGGDGR
jgi:sirohydrochlorin ferrochelatase